MRGTAVEPMTSIEISPRLVTLASSRRWGIFHSYRVSSQSRKSSSGPHPAELSGPPTVVCLAVPLPTQSFAWLAADLRVVCVSFRVNVTFGIICSETTLPTVLPPYASLDVARPSYRPLVRYFRELSKLESSLVHASRLSQHQQMRGGCRS